jgi:predicted nucleic acid-binding protein
MPVLFIDANIYIDFYRRNAKNYSSLLESIEKADRFIFVTNQIADEVRRNKVQIAGSSFEDFQSKLGISNFDLPEHLLEDEDTFANWNRDRDNLNKDERDLKEIFHDHTSEVLKKISRSEDKVSTVLESIFDQSVEPSDDHFERAKRRHTIGNPPGKPDDPVGDQISWIQLIDYINNENESSIWIITRDKDFFFEYNNECHINSFLYDDIESVVSDPDVFVFKRLSEGLNRFQDYEDIDLEDLPEDEELEEIKREEESFGSPGEGLRRYYSYPEKCPKCGTEDWHDGGGLGLRGKHPYLTIHLDCKNCDYIHDTEEPWE